MKPKLFLLGCLVLVVLKVSAQVAQSIPYQAVARDSIGSLISNHAISVRFTIRDSSAVGLVIYKETQITMTNQFGLFSLNIGQGTVIAGNFASIVWGVNYKFLQVELDASGGTNFVDMGTQQMLSVPYAMYSANSGTSENVYKNGVTNHDLSLASGIQTIAHGLGKIPKKVKITAIEGSNGGGSSYPFNLSIGVYNGSTMSVVYRAANNNAQYFCGADPNYIILLHCSSTNANNAQVATISVDETNIYLSWTKTGFGSGIANIMWEVE